MGIPFYYWAFFATHFLPKFLLGTHGYPWVWYFMPYLCGRERLPYLDPFQSIPM